MTKRHVESLLLLSRGILQDAVSLDNRLAKEVERDYQSLCSLSVEHGISLFTVFLPAMCKPLDRGLDSGRLGVLTGPLTRKVKGSSVIPRLFGGIWMRVFDKSGCLLNSESMDPTFVLILRQLLLVGKKVEVPSSSKAKYCLC